MVFCLLPVMSKSAHADAGNDIMMDLFLQNDHLTQGESCNITGTISGSNVTGIEFSILRLEINYDDGNGQWTPLCNEYPAYYDGTNTLAKTEIRYSSPRNINLQVGPSSLTQNLYFGRLDAGDYRLRVRVFFKGGDATTYMFFSVVPSSDPVKIDMSGFKSTLWYGQAYVIPGKITSTCSINKIEVSVLDAHSGGPNGFTISKYRSGYKRGNVNYSGKPVSFVWNNPGAKTISIPGSAIDNNIFFAGLNRGAYYFQITVYPKYGGPKTVRKSFTIK